MTDNKIPFEKSFASHEKANYWSDKNELNPEQILNNKSHLKYWFKCKLCKHDFEIALCHINEGKWCPYCSVPCKKICDNIECKVCFDKSFASNEKSKYWSDKNKLKPRNIIKNSNSKYVFNCDICNHEFDMDLTVINRGGWCSYCSGHKICLDIECKKCFDKSFASHEKSNYWSIKNKLKPREVFICTAESYKFDCNICFHEFDMKISSITSKNSWCQYCSNQSLCNDNDCKKCFDKSFASHEKANYWSANNNIIPRYVFKNSQKKYIFKCNECNHDFEGYLSVINRGGWCSYCSKNKLCDDNDCKICFDKSFASHEKAKYWSIKNKLKPREVTKKYSHDKYIFNCKECNHESIRPLQNIDENKSHCLYCIIPSRHLCYDNECKLCFDNSFASHEKSKYWSSKNKLIPRQVFKGSEMKFWFDCIKCNNPFDKVIYSITSKNPSWCPHCSNKTETIIYDEIKQIYANIVRQYKVEWCKNITYLPFDFCIEENKIIIELDGRQHFEQVSNWSSPEKNLENDKYKEKCANENGYSVIRLLQEDVFNDKYDWKTELVNNIEKMKTANIIQNIYMCKNNEYEKFIN